MSSISNFFQNLNCLKDSDWIEWQPDEKRRIRILDLLESVRKNTLRKSNSSASTSASSRRDKHLRSPKTSAASLPANEETGRALRLHHSRQHSHSLRNLSSTPNHHGSHVLTHDHKAVATASAASKIHPEQQQHHTFTRRLIAEQRRAKSHLECYDHEKSLSSDSDSSNGSSSRNSDVPNRRASACGLDCPDYVNGSTWYRHKTYVPPKIHSNANKRYFSNKKEDKSSKSVEYDLSVPRPSKRENLRHFTVMEPEKEAEKVPPRSTISRFREMYLADTIDAAASKKASSKTTQTSKFGCATLPTKLKQTSSNFVSGGGSGRNLASGILRNLQSNSAPQMNGKSRGFEAKRQTSAPQISSGNALPDEVRQVYQKITSGQKVTKVKKDFKSAISGGQVSPNFQETKRVLHREAFKPASHFSEVRGYEKAVPRQICKSDGFDVPDTMTTSDYNFTEITENSQVEEPNMEKAEVFFNLRPGHDLPKKGQPKVPQPSGQMPNGQPMFASTPMGLYARRNLINIDGSYRAKKVRPFDPKVFEFDANGAIVTSSPLTTAAPVPIPPSLPTQTMVKNPKILPVTINSNSGKEVEFVSATIAQQQNNEAGAWASTATAQNSDAWVTANTGETWANNAQSDGWANEQQNVAQDNGWANTGQNGGWANNQQPAQDNGWANDQNVGWPNQQAQDNGWANQQNDPNNGWADQQQAQNNDWANQQQAQNNDWANQQQAQNNDWANQQSAQNGDWANQQSAQNGDWANQQIAQNSEWANNDAQQPTQGAQSSATSWPNSGEENEFFSTNPVDVDQALEGNEEEPNSQNWITTEEYDEDNTEAPPRVSDLVQQKEEQELVTHQQQENEEEEIVQEIEETANEAPEEETVQEAFVSAAAGDSPISKDEPLTRSKLNVSFPESKRSPSRRLVNRKFQSLDLNLNMDGAASIDSSGYSGMHGPTNYWQNYQIMKHKASWLYGNNSWSRRTSDASSFISNAQEIEDLYCDDEISPNLETDPNMMLTAYLRENMGNNNPDINFPEKPCLTDRDSVLSMDIPSTGPSGPTSLRSEMGEDMEPIVEEK